MRLRQRFEEAMLRRGQAKRGLASRASAPASPAEAEETAGALQVWETPECNDPMEVQVQDMALTAAIQRCRDQQQVVVANPNEDEYPNVDLRAEEDLRAEDLTWLCQEPVIEPGPSLVLPGTFRWIIDAECARELLVVDAHLMPRKYTRWAKRACKVFVFPDRDHHSIDQLMQPIEDDWQAEEFADEFAGALSGRVPAGACRDVWALAVNGKYLQRQRTLAMALMIVSALRQPGRLDVHPDTTVDKELDHDKFQRLVDEASDELWRARGRRLADDTFEWHIMLDEEVPIVPVDELQVPVEQDVPMVTEDEVPVLSDSDSEYVSYEEYRTRKDGEKGQKKDDDRMSDSSESK